MHRLISNIFPINLIARPYNLKSVCENARLELMKIVCARRRYETGRYRQLWDKFINNVNNGANEKGEVIHEPSI
jgi:hypothetical protein